MCLLVSVNFNIHTDNEGRSEREVIVRDGCMHKHVCVSVCYSWCRDVPVLTCILISRDLLPNVSSLTFAGVFSLVFLCNN